MGGLLANLRGSSFLLVRYKGYALLVLSTPNPPDPHARTHARTHTHTHVTPNQPVRPPTHSQIQMATRMLAPAAVLLIVFGLEVAAECDSSQCCCLTGDIRLTQTGRSVLLTGPVGSAENCFGQTQTSMPCDIISPENSSCVGLQGLFTVAKVSNGITVTMPCHSSTRSTAEFRCVDGECGTTGWHGTHRRISSEPATTADSSTTEDPNTDSCEAIPCSDRCRGPCGWSTQRMLCVIGAFTNPVTEVGLGDCAGESVPEVAFCLLAPTHGSCTKRCC